MRGDLHAGPVEHRRPVDELGAARLAEPGAALGQVGFELEQVAPERLLEPRQRGLDPVGGPAKSCLAPARRARVGVAPRPPFEEPAEREGGDLDREQLSDETARGRVLDGMLVDHRGPFRPRRERRHTSTTTGRIIGRRRVRS